MYLQDRQFSTISDYYYLVYYHDYASHAIFPLKKISWASIL